MKGGSATLILLDAVCAVGAGAALRAKATAGAAPALLDGPFAEALREAWLAHAAAVSRLYACASPAVASLVEAGAAALSAPVAPGPELTPEAAAAAGRRFVSPTGFGRVFYIGAGAGGCVGFIVQSVG